MTMLDDYQKKAVGHMEGPCLVIAGPGSGKTAVITERIKALTSLHDVKHDRILVITFTRDAAESMKRRFIEISADSSCSINFGTFHSIFLHILMEESGYKSADILYGKEKEQYLKKAFSIINSQNGRSNEKSTDFYSSLEKELSYRINCMGENVEESDNAPIFKEYGKLKRNDHRIDFDDMLFQTLKLFIDKPDVLKKWRNKFDYFLVDEVQDMNRLQFRIISLLIYPQNNIFAVGDEDQAIYGFRGSDPSLMLEFPKLYPGCTVLKLENNYRSPNKIIGTAERLIRNNKSRFEKNIHPRRILKSELDIFEYDDPIEEIMDYEKRIKEDIKNTDGQSRKGPNSVIIYRNNYQGDMIQNIMSQGDLKIYRKGDKKNYNEDSPETFLMSLMKSVSGKSKRSDYLRLFDFSGIKIPRFIMNRQEISLDEMLENASHDEAIKKNIQGIKDALEVSSRLRPYAAINFFVRYTGMEENFEIKSKLPDDFFERLRFIMEESKSFQNINSFYNFLNDNSKLIKTVPYDEADVGLYTFHSSKGLEFDNVYIPDLNEGIVPLLRKTDEKSIEEERRMLYVAITRARSKVVLGSLKSRGDSKMYPSRFIREMGLSL